MCETGARTYAVEQSKKWEHFYATDNFESLAALYTQDCKLLVPGQSIAEGRIGECATITSVQPDSHIVHVM